MPSGFSDKAVYSQRKRKRLRARKKKKVSTSSEGHVEEPAGSLKDSRVPKQRRSSQPKRKHTRRHCRRRKRKSRKSRKGRRRNPPQVRVVAFFSTSSGAPSSPPLTVRFNCCPRPKPRKGRLAKSKVRTSTRHLTSGSGDVCSTKCVGTQDSTTDRQLEQESLDLGDLLNNLSTGSDEKAYESALHLSPLSNLYLQTNCQNKNFEVQESESCRSFSQFNFDLNIDEQLLTQALDEFAVVGFIVRDDSKRCGFSVTYPDKAMMEAEKVNSVGTQLGEGILKDSFYSVAVDFAQKHGYGFVEFMDDQPDRRPNRTRARTQKNRKSFARVVSTREEKRSVVKREVRSRQQQSRVNRCLAKPDVQRESILSHLSFERSLKSVESIAEQISDIQIPDCRKITSKQNWKSSVRRHADGEGPDKEVPARGLKGQLFKSEEEIISSAPLGEYMEYLSNVCKDIYQSTGKAERDVCKDIHWDTRKTNHEQPSPDLPTTVGQSGLEASGDTLNKPRPTSLLSDTEACGESQGDSKDRPDSSVVGKADVDQESKNASRQSDSNNNVSRETKSLNQCSAHRHPARKYAWKEAPNTSHDARLPGLKSKTTKQYRFSNSLSSCISRELESVDLTPESELGVRCDALKAKIEVVRYSRFPGQSDQEESDSDVEESADAAVSQPTRGSQGRKAANPSTSSPTRSPAHARQRDATRQPPSGAKSLVDYSASSCPDLSSPSRGQTRDGGRNRDAACASLKSPAKDCASASKKSAADNEAACAQGDVMSPPSLFVDVLPQEQGDVEIFK